MMKVKMRKGLDPNLKMFSMLYLCMWSTNTFVIHEEKPTEHTPMQSMNCYRLIPPFSV